MALLEQVVNGIFEDGVNRGTIKVLNIVILALIMSIFLGIFTSTKFNIHLYVILFLSLGLLLSVNYYMSLLESGDNEAKEGSKQEEPKKQK
mmetsp:Transcript_29287/g.71406  ORF Transcript_29287/g.71406 Transcript_29287/m.71406 type:complete len:91 (-) Transcript_29287:27-299(-)